MGSVKVCFINTVMKNTTEQFISRSQAHHGDKFDYSQVVYSNTHSKVDILCPIHGLFQQSAMDHMKGSGCNACSGKKRLTTQQFVIQLHEIFGDSLDYSLVDYKNISTNVTLICPIHGKFSKSPRNLMQQRKSCQECGKVKSELITDSKRSTLTCFISKSRKVHGDTYDYTQAVYINSKTKLTIVCQEHGSFTQTPSAHTDNHQGCPWCGELKKGGIGGYTVDFFNTASDDIKQKPATLYAIEMTTPRNDHFIKVGITTRDIKTRFSGAKIGPHYIHRNVLHSITLPLYKAFLLEQQLLADLISHKFYPNYKFVGYTECLKYNTVVIESINNMLCA